MEIGNQFISDEDWNKILNYYDFEFEEGEGKVFIEETNETISIEECLEHLIPSILLVENKKMILFIQDIMII